MEIDSLYLEVGLTMPNAVVVCHACDESIEINEGMVVRNLTGEFYGWQCACCGTLYNSRSEVIELGDFGEIEQAEA